MERRRKRIVIIGGGLGGLSAAMKLCELHAEVVLVAYQALKRSHSVCAQGGINAAIDAKDEGDSPEKHFYDTIKGGDFLAHQRLVRDMCFQAPSIIHLLDRMGVPFNRTKEGHLEFRRFGGTLYSRTAFAGATTGQQMVYALDEQVRRYSQDGFATCLEWHEFLGTVLDGRGVCRGAIIHDLRTQEIFTIPADAVILATGGPSQVYAQSTASTVNTGAAATMAYLQGAKYANGEFIQIHPTAIPGPDKLRLMSESARGEGGRIWVPQKPGDTRDPKTIPESERFYFLEEKFPHYGNLVPRDVACREIYDIVFNQKLGIGGQAMVYLDLTHLSTEFLDDRLGGIIDIYTKFTGENPRTTPMKIFPGRALFHGRALDRLPTRQPWRRGSPIAPKPDDVHPGALRGGGSRLSVPRRQPAGGQLFAELHLRRADDGSRGAAISRKPRPDGRGRVVETLRGRRGLLEAALPIHPPDGRR